MRRSFTSLLATLTFCTAVVATVRTEMRMHVFSNGDNGMNIVKALAEVDSVKFTNDTLDSRKYEVTFLNWDGKKLQSDSLQSGSMPAYVGEGPEREQTAAYTYTFKGWTPEIEKVQKEVTYTADYDSTIRKYAVAFRDLDGEILSLECFNYGSTPSCNVKPQTKESTKLYDYVAKWNPELTEVTDNAIYKAYLDSVKHTYTCIFKNYDGEELFRTYSGTYDYDRVGEPIHDETDYTYKFKEWSLDESQIEDNVLVFNAVFDSTLITKKNGALIRASYKVADGKSVYFSQGNLQFNAWYGTHTVYGDTAEKAGTWRFAENQYDIIGKDNQYIDSTYTDWIDLFGWGTSGWKSGANAYQPWAISQESSDYYIDGNYSISLTGSYAEADWGVYNAISNGGDMPNRWRTLTTSEWNYLFQNNKWTLGYIKTTEKDSILCFMLIPETFTAPEGTTVELIGTANLTLTAMFYTVPSNNKYTTEQFASLEKSGVVALPCGGYRSNGTKMNKVGLYGSYWSSSAYDSSNAYGFYFVSTYANSDNYNCRRSNGWSVRLVKDL